MMFERFRAAADRLNKVQREVRESAEALRVSNPRIPDVPEPVSLPVAPTNITANVCAVDGGLIAQELYGIDLIVSRAIAVNFPYENSKLTSASYFPNPFPEPVYEVKVGQDEHELLLSRTLLRLDLEISAAIGAIEKFKPRVLLLDGSIIPLSSDRPAEGSETFSAYSALISKYLQLYESCKKSGTLLIGITKDSRGRRFMDIVGSHVPNRWPDTLFLNYFLKERERTFTMRYSSSPSKHAVLRDLGQYADLVSLFYLKCSREDRPIRVEFLYNEANIPEIASVVYSLSAINPAYTYPAVLIEADLRAAIDPIEIERVQKSFLSFSNFIQPLKRNSRPFR